MNLTDALNTFALRLYDWSWRDFLRELEADCPLLRPIGQHQRSIGGLVSWNKSLSSADRRQLARAMTLLFHENARKLKGETITDAVRAWGDAFYEQTSAHM